MATSPAFRAKPRDVKIAEVVNIIGEVYDFPELSKRTLGRECLETSYAVQARLNDSGTPIDYRLQHMSNGVLYDSNPGLNMHMIEVGYRF